jgi:uncharacterized DUF497 family protein
LHRIEAFLWDDDNEAKVAAHGLRPEDVDATLETRHAVFSNPRGRPGSAILVGRDGNGRWITIVIEPVPSTDDWRPRTAWPSKLGEITRARKQGM